MQAVILAAGRGTRMGALTEETPKPMLVVSGKNLIEHKIDILPAEIDEVIIIIGYKDEVIRNYFGGSYNGRKITYVKQEELKGTGAALWLTKEHVHGRFLVMYGDDIYDESDIKELLKYPWSLLVYQEVKKKRSGGKVILHEDKTLKDIVEGEHDGNILIWTGAGVLDDKIFSYDLVKIPGRVEYGLPQTVVSASRDVPIKIVTAKKWIQVTSPEDIGKAEEILSRKV